MPAPTSWDPFGFERYKELYPSTPSVALPDLLQTQNFIEIWQALKGTPGNLNNTHLQYMIKALQNTTIILIRGFLGNYMPGNLVQISKALRALGLDAFIARNSARSTIAENAKRIAAEILYRVKPTRRLLFLGHSKGGLEAQWVISFNSTLMKRTSGIIMSQTPLGSSAVLESLLSYQHQDSLRGLKRKYAERLQRLGVYMIGAHRGGKELTAEKLPAVINLLQANRNENILLFQTASWSSFPTTWLDSFHQRLGEIRPGCAHDGQFYIENLIWPKIPHVLLPNVDHAQPVVGGFGFDVTHYWLAMIITFLKYKKATLD
jgi:hypothetical protein